MMPDLAIRVENLQQAIQDCVSQSANRTRARRWWRECALPSAGFHLPIGYLLRTALTQQDLALRGSLLM